MRTPLAITVLGFSLALFGCGNGNNSQPVNLSGNWTANLQQTSGTTAFSFTTTLTEVGGSILNGSNLSFSPASSCFSSQITESGNVQFSSSGYGYYTGGGQTAMSLSIKGLSSSGATDALTMQGTVNPDNSVSGTWSLNGLTASCSGSGGFTMTRH